MHILFAGRARNWYWRYHKKVDRIIWSDFCFSLRQQYTDYRSEFASKELIRSRKQKVSESFTNFYEGIVSLIDKSSVRIDEEELIEILKNNLLPEARHQLLYQPVHPVAQLRKLVQMHENLVAETSSQRENSSRNKQPFQRRPIYTVAELDAENGQIEDMEPEIAAVHQSNIRCWNCDTPGHVWENCLAERRVFCYGCGALNVYKPQCKTCIQHSSENRQKGASNNNRMPLAKTH